MTDSLDFAGENRKLPTGINVLTILTFIGCALDFAGTVWRFITAEKSYTDLQKMQDKMEQVPPFVRKMMGPEALENARKAMENKVPLLLIALISIGLCVYGAIEMRKLKKQGFILWAVGEFLPIIGALIFMGAGIFSGFGAFMLLIPVIFLILYGVNRKHLVY